MMKYIESAGSPRRTTTYLAGTISRRRSRAISAMRAGVEAGEERHAGDGLPGHHEVAPPQLRGEPVARIPAGTANIAMPRTMTTPAKILPRGVTG